MSDIYVTKPFLPPKKELYERFDKIYQSGILTNQGPMVLELEDKIKRYLSASYFHYLNNGTLALQLALKALNIIDGEVITTPFTYVATISSILWERATPVFVDIEPRNFTIDVSKIEEKITKKTKAIMPVHVFGYACNVEEIERLARKHNLKVIYDAAHAFGSFYKGKSLVSYGDISTVSFHATKLFHTIEGGGCFTSNEAYSQKIELLKKFGSVGDKQISLGINAKQDEFNAAMGLANLKYIDQIITKRKLICEQYNSKLASSLGRPVIQEGLKYNYAYYPVIFDSEKQLQHTFKILNENKIFPRRYFYPSLNTLPYIKNYCECPISEDISKRIACLPLYVELDNSDVDRISELILSCL